MKKLKKPIGILCVFLVLLFCLIGCSSSNPGEGKESDSMASQATGQQEQGREQQEPQSVISTVAVRLLLSYLLGIILKMGIIGIALAMVCDWIARAVLFIGRERSGRWKTFQVIKS